MSNEKAEEYTVMPEDLSLLKQIADAGDDKVKHESGATSSYCPDFAQIPVLALIRLAKRFELGAKKHGRKNYMGGVHDKSYVIERLNHVIHHCYKLIQKLEGDLPFDKDDDAGGIMWGGAFATLAVAFHHPEEFKEFE